MLGKFKNSKPKVARLRVDLENSKRQISRLAEMEKAAIQRRGSVAHLEARLSKSVAIDTLLADLSAMAKEAHVRIESLEPMEVKKAASDSGGVYAEIPVQVWAKGGFHQLAAFINALESNPRLMQLVRLEISNGGGDQLWQQSAHIMVSTFRLLESAKVAP